PVRSKHQEGQYQAQTRVGRARSHAKARSPYSPGSPPCALFSRCLDRVHQSERPLPVPEDSSRPNVDRGYRAAPGLISRVPAPRRRKFPFPDADGSQVPAVRRPFFLPPEIAFWPAIRASAQGGTRKLNKLRIRMPSSMVAIVV